MMVKVVPYRRWGIIRFVRYCKFFNWEGSLGLDERQKNAIETLIAGGLHIKFVAASKNVQVFKIWW